MASHFCIKVFSSDIGIILYLFASEKRHDDILIHLAFMLIGTQNKSQSYARLKGFNIVLDKKLKMIWPVGILSLESQKYHRYE